MILNVVGWLAPPGAQAQTGQAATGGQAPRRMVAAPPDSALPEGGIVVIDQRNARLRLSR